MNINCQEHTTNKCGRIVFVLRDEYYVEFQDGTRGKFNKSDLEIFDESLKKL